MMQDEATRGPGQGWLRRMLGTGAAEARSARPTPPAEGARRLLCIGPDAAAIADLSARLEADLPDLEVVQAPTTVGGPAGHAPPAEGGRRAAVKWLSSLVPDLVLWHGALSPGPLVDALVEYGAPVVAVGVPDPGPEGTRARRAWRTVLSAPVRLLARDEAAARTLRLLGPAGLRVEVAGEFVPVPEPPPCEERDRDHFAHVLAVRPAWLAVFPAKEELPGLLEAHRIGLRGAHRLLMMLAPPEDAEGAPLAQRLRAEGWQVARHGAGEEPHDGTEIFVTDSREEMGLWYRLAPLCVLGGSFAPGPAGASDPADPARLGSAIIAGPQGAPHMAMLDRLERAGGLSRLDALEALGPALADLLAPDRAAQLAQAAWDVASDGARVQERVVAAIRDVLRDGAGAA